jgi:uncharacterized protein (UPF0332 family)
MGFFMEDHKSIMLNNSIIKSVEAYKDANLSIKNQRYNMASNRIYYSIYYSVLALAYKENFITSKHKQLMGWFNKKYIYEEKIFDKKLIDIYKNASKERQESDYEILDLKIKGEERIILELLDAKYFINTIIDHLNKSTNLNFELI